MTGMLCTSAIPNGRYRDGVNNDASTEGHPLGFINRKEVLLKNIPEGDLAQVRFDRDESAIAFGLYRDTAPYDIYHMSLEQEPQQLTTALNPAINSDLLVEGKVVRFASYDGLQFLGFCISPKKHQQRIPYSHGVGPWRTRR